MCTVNQQILAAVELGVSPNKVIWHLLNLASHRLCCVHRRHLRMLAVTNHTIIRATFVCVFVGVFPISSEVL